MRNHYECFKNNDSESKEKLEHDASQVGSNQKKYSVKKDTSECSVVKRNAKSWIRMKCRYNMRRKLSNDISRRTQKCVENAMKRGSK